MLTGIQIVALAALTKGALGLEFGWNSGDDIPNSEFFKFGETDDTFVWAGVAIIAIG